MDRTIPMRSVCLFIVLVSLTTNNHLYAGVYSIGSGHTCTAYNDIDGDSLNYTAPASPFSNAHSIQFGDWTCSSLHSGSFDAQQGAFSMTDQLQARDIGDYTYALSSGGFSLRTDTDILVSYSGTMDYALPGNSTDASLDFYADRYDFPSGQNTTLWSDFDGLVTPDPATGTAHISGSFILPALLGDSFYSLSLGMNLYTSGDPFETGNLLTAGGTMMLTYSVVPEPATVGCLLISLAAFGRKQPR